MRLKPSFPIFLKLILGRYLKRKFKSIDKNMIIFWKKHKKNPHHQMKVLENLEKEED